MKMVMVLVKEFNNLIESGGIQQTVAAKTDTGAWRVFGVNIKQQVVYYIKKARGSNEIREWKGINFVCTFLEKQGVSKFTVQGLNNNDRENKDNV